MHNTYLEAELNDSVLTGARGVICWYEAGEFVEGAILAKDVAGASVQMQCVGLLVPFELIQPPPVLRILTSLGFGIQGLGFRNPHILHLCCGLQAQTDVCMMYIS